MSEPFRIGLTRDLRAADGSTNYGDLGLGMIEAEPGMEWAFLDAEAAELTPEHVAGFDALVVLYPRVSLEAVESSDRLKVIARMGVGYDSVPVRRCTELGIPVTLTPEAVRRPVATSALALLLGLTHQLFLQDRLVRTDRWAEARKHPGFGLVDRTLGVLGMGNIGAEFLTIAKPLGMRQVVHDPYADPARAAELGVELVGLEELLRSADVVVVLCPLTDETRHLLDAERLALLKPTSYVINMGRGPIIDQAAITAALREGRIAGAGLDVFETEPLPADDPLTALDNVILSTHGLATTDQFGMVAGRRALSSILDVAAGRRPPHVANPDVFAHPRFAGTPAAAG
ncbi:dehydrogenase [Baekduia soli]|uniref:Dehydrogenase n=1 Tax=Baekduia soli TaxID=496014 RepID=A0A5B8U3K3_9ACTN|nr:NAD(P)-dependent oxidoreductase [Baekduia soli]QEC47570.1 dehydrogenase [Baekduia soli]